jgi:hypothetical protein
LFPLPGLRFFGVDFYLVTTLVYAALFVAAVLFVQVRHGVRFDEGRKRYVGG